MDCPSCGAGIIVPGGKRGNRMTTLFLMGIFVLAILVSLEAVRWNRKIQHGAAAVNVAAQADSDRLELEHFPLEDAYKPAPLSFSESGASRLYGKLLPDADSVMTNVANSAQSLDEKLVVQAELESVRQQAIAVVEQVKSSMKDHATESNRDYINRIQYVSEVADKLFPDVKTLLDLGTKRYNEKIQALNGRGALYSVAGNTRVKVIDITGHYAKVRALDGDAKGKVFFVVPDYLRVK